MGLKMRATVPGVGKDEDEIDDDGWGRKAALNPL